MTNQKILEKVIRLLYEWSYFMGEEEVNEKIRSAIRLLEEALRMWIKNETRPALPPEDPDIISRRVLP